MGHENEHIRGAPDGLACLLHVCVSRGLPHYLRRERWCRAGNSCSGPPACFPAKASFPLHPPPRWVWATHMSVVCSYPPWPPGGTSTVHPTEVEGCGKRGTSQKCSTWVDASAYSCWSARRACQSCFCVLPSSFPGASPAVHLVANASFRCWVKGACVPLPAGFISFCSTDFSSSSSFILLV